jgi:hypothetical protein
MTIIKLAIGIQVENAGYNYDNQFFDLSHFQNAYEISRI